MVGRVPVHLNRVQGLGDYLEPEIVLAYDEPDERRVDEARALMARLEVDPARGVEGACLRGLAGKR